MPFTQTLKTNVLGSVEETDLRITGLKCVTLQVDPDQHVEVSFYAIDSTFRILPQRSHFLLGLPYFNKWYHKQPSYASPQTKDLISFTLTLLPNSYLSISLIGFMSKFSIKMSIFLFFFPPSSLLSP